MKSTLASFLILTLFFSCNISKQIDKDGNIIVDYQDIIEEDYELSKSQKRGNTTLVLFGGFSENATDIKREFDFLEIAKKNQVTVLWLNYNRKLWMTEVEKKELGGRLESIFSANNLSTENVYFGGFSSGGNISLMLSDHLILTNSTIQPKGIFVVDSPVDLLELYRLSERNIVHDFSKTSIQEATWLLNLFEEELGIPEDGLKKYEEYSPYTSETKNISNLSNLDGLNIRFYSEPDTTWWEENRNNNHTDLNAYWIEKLTNQLKKELANSTIEYITTKNKGSRANGERHPHSWSIVNKEELVRWMLKK